MSVIHDLRRRRLVRRAVRTACQAVTADDFRLLGQRVLDMSPHGLMIAADDRARVGQELILAFQAPGSSRWFDAEGRVARVIEGFRPWDPGYCVGVELTDITLADRLDLHDRLRGLPPPVPARGLRQTWVPRGVFSFA